MSLATESHSNRPPELLSAVAGGVVRHSSRVLHELLDFPQESRVTVLDTGNLQPETLRFFADRRCRIIVPRLREALDEGAFDQAEGDPGLPLEKRFQNCLNLPGGTRLDLCLLWDFPHYLNEVQLRAFSRALWPWLHPGSKAFLFGVHSGATVLLSRDYGIQDAQTITVRPREGKPPDSPHPQSFMNEWLTCFAVSRGVLLADGKVETLMRARV